MMNDSHVTVCRLCMGHGDGMVPISSGQANYTKLILVFQLKLLNRVGVPSHICHVCLDHLDAAHQFKRQILNVGKTLQALYGKVCVTKAKSKLIDSLSREQVDFENGGEVPISFAEIDTEVKEVPTGINLEPSEIINLDTSSGTTENNQEVAVNEEVDPIAIDNEDTACLVNSIIKVEDCTTANDSHASFVYVSTNTEMEYVSIVDHIDPPSLEVTLETKKQKEVDNAKKTRKIDKSEFEVEKNCRCLICGKTYWSVKLFTSHMQTQHGTNMHDLLKDSSKASNISRKYRCGFCRAAFSYKKQLKSHPCSAQQPKNQFTGHVKCSRCGKLFSVLKDLNEHIAKSHMHKCNICDKRFQKDSGLVNHMERIHKNEDGSNHILNNESEKETQKKANIRNKKNEEMVPITHQLHIVTPNSISSKIQPAIKTNAEDLAPYNQQHVQTTKNFPLQDNNVLVKEEVDLGTETVGTLTIEEYNNCEANHHQLIQTSQTMGVDIGENDTGMWQTIFPVEEEPFFDASTFMEEAQESEASHFDETQSMTAMVQKENNNKCCSCLICNASFQYFSQFIEHMTNHDYSEMNRRPKAERIPCTVCKRDFLNINSFKRHLIRAKCPKSPVNAKLAAQHATRAMKQAAQKAAQQVAANKNAAHSKKTQAMWKAVSRNSVKCSTCSQTFTQTKELETHLRKHKYSNSKYQEFGCVHCDKVFLYKLRLRNHIEKYHAISVDT